MTIEQAEVVDVIHIDKKSEEVVLTIADHLEWTEPAKDHLLLLQDKINAYLRFVESGELYQEYPNARGKRIVICVVGQYPTSESAEKFYNQVTPIIEGAGFNFRFELFKDPA